MKVASTYMMINGVQVEIRPTDNGQAQSSVLGLGSRYLENGPGYFEYDSQFLKTGDPVRIARLVREDTTRFR